MVEHGAYRRDPGSGVLIFIENVPRAYAWGSNEALPAMLGVHPTGDPQAELWLGAHPDDPADLAKATPGPRTLIDLIESDPEQYGVNGGPLPFLLKVLAIGAPLSLQVHPDLAQAREGFAREEAAGVPRDARHRNYGDDNHKPELLVALTEVRALSGFRPIDEAARDLALLASAARSAGDDAGARAFEASAARLRGADADALRRGFIEWVFSGDLEVARALDALQAQSGCDCATPSCDCAPLSFCGSVGDRRIFLEDEARAASLAEILAHHPGDPGALVSLLLNHVVLQPGESIYLPARHLHAYMAGVGVEIMASSDNVLRAGLTSKHVDIPELLRVLDASTLDDPVFPHEKQARGLVAWRPDVPDFELLRARVSDPESSRPPREGAAVSVAVPAESPLVLIVTDGRVRIARQSDELGEVASARRGQSLYVSAGAPIALTGDAEVFIATVGRSAA